MYGKKYVWKKRNDKSHSRNIFLIMARFFSPWLTIYWYFYWCFLCLWISLFLQWILCNFIRDFITNQITSCFCCSFLNALIFIYQDQDVSDCIYRLSFTYPFTHAFSHNFSKKQKSIAFYKYSTSRFNWITRQLLYITL